MIPTEECMKNSIETGESSGAAALWDVRACATYLKKSQRWLWSAMHCQRDEKGSIPHVRVGVSPRFIPTDIEEWVRQGCPPASIFFEWRDAANKHRKRLV
jgi:hypothetical protein